MVRYVSKRNIIFFIKKKRLLGHWPESFDPDNLQITLKKSLLSDHRPSVFEKLFTNFTKKDLHGNDSLWGSNTDELS